MRRDIPLDLDLLIDLWIVLNDIPENRENTNSVHFNSEILIGGQSGITVLYLILRNIHKWNQI